MTNQWQQTYQPPSDQIANLAEAVKLLMQAAHVSKTGYVWDAGRAEAARLLEVIGHLREQAYPSDQQGA